MDGIATLNHNAMQVLVAVMVEVLLLLVVMGMPTHLAHFLVRDHSEDIAVDQLDSDQYDTELFCKLSKLSRILMYERHDGGD